MALKGTRLFEYRLLWAYKGSSYRHVLLSQRPSAILRRLRRVGTVTPWDGATVTAVRKCWMRLSLLLDAPFSSIANQSAQSVLLGIQRAYPELEYIRVEWRQVGDWMQMLDPLTNLRGKNSERGEQKLKALYTSLAAMTPEQLNNWRLIPPDMRGDMRPSAQRKKYSHAAAAKLKRRRMGGQPSGFERVATAPEKAEAAGTTGDTE